MKNSEYTIKSQLVFEVLSSLSFLLISIWDVFFDSKYTSYTFLAYGLALVIILLIKSFFRGINDEFSEKNLSRVNEKSINFLFTAILLVAIIITTPAIFNSFKSIEIIGIILMLILVAFTIFRLFLFIYYDRKGICD